MGTDLAAQRQRTVALQRGTATRVQRAAFKRSLKCMDRAAAVGEVVALLTGDLPVWARTWEVGDLLRSLPWTGPTRARSIANGAKVSLVSTLGALVVPQRERLADVLVRPSENRCCDCDAVVDYRSSRCYPCAMSARRAA